jgi:hypothetical protein
VRYSFMMAILLALSSAAHAASFTFLSDPFAGTDVLTNPGRQIVGGEPSIVFNVATDKFVFAKSVFGVEDLVFATGLAADIPSTGVNVVALQDVGPPMNAGLAANLIAEQITDSAPGFFIYFNTGLNLPRLVFSTNLGDNTADLKILARMTNFAGQPEVLSAFGPGNFTATPEPSTVAMVGAGAVLAAWASRKRRKAARKA